MFINHPFVIPEAGEWGKNPVFITPARPYGSAVSNCELMEDTGGAGWSVCVRMYLCVRCGSSCLWLISLGSGGCGVGGYFSVSSLLFYSVRWVFGANEERHLLKKSARGSAKACWQWSVMFGQCHPPTAHPGTHYQTTVSFSSPFFPYMLVVFLFDFVFVQRVVPLDGIGGALLESE